MEIICRVLTDKEITNVSLTLAEAFQKDPVFHTIFQNYQELRDFLQLATKYCNKFGEVHYVEDYSGAALWLPPGVPFLSVKNILRTKDMLVDCLRLAFTLSLRRRINLRKAGSYTSSKHITTQHYYLFAIGVQSVKQGQGIGKSLMDFAISKFGDKSVYYLENSNVQNINFYESCGLRVLSEGQFNGARMFFMVRGETD